MTRTSHGARIGLLGLVCTVVLSGTAAAQWHVNAIGVAEVDTKSTLLLLGGLSASPGGKGIAPLIGFQAYHLGYDAGSVRRNVFTFKPYVGLENGYDGGSVYGTVGYAFTNNAGKNVTSLTGTSDVGDGTVVAAGWDHWGTGGPMGYQVLGSYNTNTESFWGRGRVTKLWSKSGASQKRIGGEIAYLAGKGYSAVQPGLVLELHDPNNHILGLGAGMKFFGNGGGTAAYFKVEGFLPLVK